MNIPVFSQQKIVDADHPWLGLAAFSEQTQRFFFGRTGEIRDLFLRVRENTLTILYSQSGLGKTSLLGAGLLPKLRVERFRPILLRLRYDAQDPPLLAQVRAALAQALADQEATPQIQAWLAAGSLWEIFHTLNLKPPGLDSAPLVIIFDQFEEAFTLGQSETRRAETSRFIAELAELVENRVPPVLQARLRRHRRAERDFDLRPSAVHVILTLREDYLSQLEAWKSEMPSLMRNRMPLALLSGAQALEAIVRPGALSKAPLVDEAVAAQIVRFVARSSPQTPLSEIRAVPPLLSLICDELNESRLCARSPAITAEQVEKQSADILQNFYVRSFAHLSPDAAGPVRRLVEDRLLTVSGNRSPMALDDAIAELEAQGVALPLSALNKLIAGRLLSTEERRGYQRIEITHDVLAPLVMRSRGERRERERAERVERENQQLAQRALEMRRERNRLRRMLGAMAVLAALAIAGVVVASIALLRIQVAERRAKQTGQVAEGLANAMLFEFRDQLKTLGKLELMDTLSLEVEHCYTNLTNLSDVAKGNQAMMLDFRGDVLLDKGKLKEALEAYARERDICSRLTNGPPNDRFRLELGNSYMKLGNASLQKADLERAATYCRQSVELYRRLAENHPGEPRFQVELGSAWANLGDVAIRERHFKAARHDYQRTIDLCTPLTETNFAIEKARFVKAKAYTRQGDVDRLEGCLKEAQDKYQKAIVIGRQLAEEDPSNSEFQQHLSDTYTRLGLLAESKGLVAQARDFHQKGREIRQRLARSNRASCQAKRDLSMSFIRLGDVALQSGQLPEAKSNFDKALELRQALATNDPNNIIFQRDWSFSCEKLGDLALEEYNVGAASRFYQQSGIIRIKLWRDNTNNPQIRRDVSTSYINGGDLASCTGDFQTASNLYARALVTRSNLVNISSDMILAQRDLAQAYEKLGNVALAQQQGRAIETARNYYGESAKILRRLALANQENAQVRHDLGTSYMHLGDVEFRGQHFDAARTNYEEAVSIRRGLAQIDSTNAKAQWELALSEAKVAHGYLFAGQFEKAKQIYLAHRAAKFRDNVPLLQMILEDFEQFRLQGLAPPDTARMRKILENAPPFNNPPRN